MEQDGNDKTLYHATVNGVQIDYIFKSGALYDKKMNAIVGSPNKQGYVEVSGGYYNNAFAGGANQAFGGSQNKVQNIGGVNYVVTVQDGRVQYADGRGVYSNTTQYGQTSYANATGTSSQKSSASIQEAFQNSVRGGDFDNVSGLQCVDLTKWFIDTYTTLDWTRGNGFEQAANIAAKNNLPDPSSTPKAWSVYSVAPFVKEFGGSGDRKEGHTGIVLSVDEVNKTATVIHTGKTLENKTPNSWITTYSYPASGVTFTYIGNHLK